MQHDCIVMCSGYMTRGWLNDERTKQPVRYLIRGVLVRVVPVGSCVTGDELIDKRASRSHRLLGEACYPIPDVGHPHSVPVDRGGHRKVVDQGDPDPIALSDPQFGSRDRAVESPGELTMNPFHLCGERES